ncbi:hypothetical protein B0H67DRAFT_66612 [Lasiosphaeris hirsuta]|uniref:Uncharacterized protein n=1 Tax=Lasiosphaeris hirsuta TaxID=260670 RepID=A0AA40EDF9_9PEZI|nr:hypothetical protein B0H67DRAFT_66612 [Lasiosphaeris hirsuta]
MAQGAWIHATSPDSVVAISGRPCSQKGGASRMGFWASIGEPAIAIRRRPSRYLASRARVHYLGTFKTWIAPAHETRPRKVWGKLIQDISTVRLPSPAPFFPLSHRSGISCSIPLLANVSLVFHVTRWPPHTQDLGATLATRYAALHGFHVSPTATRAAFAKARHACIPDTNAMCISTPSGSSNMSLGPAPGELGGLLSLAPSLRIPLQAGAVDRSERCGVTNKLYAAVDGPGLAKSGILTIMARELEVSNPFVRQVTT